MTAPTHLRRLGKVWPQTPVYLINTCTAGRRPLLANPTAHAIFREEWMGMKARHGWAIGRYVIMPDHVHFFAAPAGVGHRALAAGIGLWKEWTSKRLLTGAATSVQATLWQREFFDHLIRSTESRTEKWNYVFNNPVRAGLVSRPEDWPYAGAIDFE